MTGTLLIKQLVSVTLESCPFCGSDNLSTRFSDNPEFCIKCNNCSAQGPTVVSGVNPIDGWNSLAQKKQKEIKLAVDTAVDEALSRMPPVSVDAKPA